ncbi:hypothetical protein GCM10010472_31870 [Pseudonocardia halophobica]|uniref:DUF3558 domain-containing protein n=1 Tax=Pseudonocardia halophobica TaxID=29401 RepID=A0A9W6NUM1_9PSEU|nr:DUF3558 family protein [Pseudonocardia halophobica]GLL10435.1 hypothetical protein GCM10017577_15750 [Pseudonocardia halophobica]
MRVRSVRFPQRSSHRFPHSRSHGLVRTFALVAALGGALALSGCSGGGGDQAASSVPAATPASSAAPSAAAAPGIAPGEPNPAGDGGALPQACELVPQEEIAQATGLAFGTPTPTGGTTRSVCAYPASGTVPGLSVGVESGSRFDAKAAASRSSVGVPGVDVPGLGDQALFFYSDRDFPEGLGGLLVRSGGATIDVSLQGSGTEQQTRDAAAAIARVALDNV